MPVQEIREGRRLLTAEAWDRCVREGIQSDQSRGVPAPPLEKPFPEDADLIDLVSPEHFRVGEMSVRDAIARRRSRRSYLPDPLTLEELSYLLWATQGVTKVLETRSGPRTLRTVPSGGARHALETYLAISRVEGLSPGLYRYLPLEHKLLPIRSDGELPLEVVKGCRGQEFVGQAAVVFIWTAVPYRMEWRYTIMSPKLIALDAGHVCQNLYLACESIGAGTCAIAAYSQEAMDALLGVDGQEEFTIYVAPVGKVETAL